MMTLRGNIKRCETLQAIQANTGKRVMVIGTYIQIDIRMRKKGKPQHIGYAAVQLTDETLVLLGPSWSSAAIRSVEERVQFENKQVEVIGTVHLQTPEHPKQIAYVMGSCISPVEQIQLSQR